MSLKPSSMPGAAARLRHPIEPTRCITVLVSLDNWRTLSEMGRMGLRCSLTTVCIDWAFGGFLCRSPHIPCLSSGMLIYLTADPHRLVCMRHRRAACMRLQSIICGSTRHPSRGRRIALDRDFRAFGRSSLANAQDLTRAPTETGWPAMHRRLLS